MSAPHTVGNLNGLRFTDRILCSAVETEAGYLAKVGRADLARMNQNHLFYENQELTKIGITIAKLLGAKGRAKRK